MTTRTLLRRKNIKQEDGNTQVKLWEVKNNTGKMEYGHIWYILRVIDWYDKEDPTICSYKNKQQAINNYNRITNIPKEMSKDNDKRNCKKHNQQDY